MGFFTDIKLADDFEDGGQPPKNMSSTHMDEASEEGNDVLEGVLPEETSYSFSDIMTDPEDVSYDDSEYGFHPENSNGDDEEDEDEPDDEDKSVESDIEDEDEEEDDEKKEEQKAGLKVSSSIKAFPSRHENPTALKKKEKKSNAGPEIKTSPDKRESSQTPITVIAKGCSVGNINATTDISIQGKCEGDISTDGDVEVIGEVTGHISAKGHVSVKGNVAGGIQAGTVAVSGAKVKGDISCRENLSIENESVVIGNISGTSLSLSGAAKGEIDIQGPVILSATAVVQGNIKSAAISMEAGALVDGMCSQCYAKKAVGAVFEGE